MYIAGSRLPCTEGSVTVVSDVYNSSLQLVEMCSSEGVWSPVCDYNWTMDDATVVCRELEYTFLGKLCCMDYCMIMIIFLSIIKFLPVYSQ